MAKDKYSYRILVVEDNPGDYLLIKDYLEDHILLPEFTHARNFKQTKALLADTKIPFDIILLDLSLPDKCGEELINEIITITGKIPVIVLTGYSDLDFAVKSLSIGLSDYLIKEDLTSTILYKSIIYNLERYRHIKRIQDSEKRYSELFQLSPIPMWLCDFETLQILDINEAAIRHYGFSYKEFLAMTMLDLRPEEAMSALEKSYELLDKNDSSYFQGIFQHKKKNGELIFVDIRSNILLFKDKKSAIILANDVTDRILHTKTIEQQNVKLKEIAWLQSHVVRAPLARMMGLINMLVDEELTKKERKEFLLHTMNSALELDEIIKDVVNKSKQVNVNHHKK